MISYPLALPASPPGLASVEMTAESIVGISASPTTAQQQIYEWAGQFWRAKCGLPPMSRANAERWLSFLLSLRGMTGTFLLGDPLGKTPQGTAGGSPIVSGAGQTGKKLAISGLTGVLKAGDYFHIGSAGENLLLYSQDLDQSSAWGPSNNAATNPTVTANTIVAPDGTTTAESIAFPLVPNTVGAQSFLFQVILASLVAAQSATFSIWLKVPSGTGSIQIVVQDNPFTQGLAQACALTTSWQRFSVSFTFGSTINASVLAFLNSPQNAAAVTVHAWGAQLERGLVLNNYIPTTSIASGPTRQLLKNLVDAGPGSVTLDIFPKLRISPLNADPLILTNSVGLFRLASNSTPWTVDKAKFYGISFEAVEAL